MAALLFISSYAISNPYRSIIRLSNDHLIERLSEEKDFQEICTSVKFLIEKIKETKTGNNFKAFVLQQATNEDIEVLSAKLLFNNKSDFFSYLRNISKLKANVLKKFPELSGHDSRNEIISAAATKVIENQKKPQISTAECWLWWTNGLFACSQMCTFDDDYNSCWWLCSGAISSAAGWCFLEAD
jgi:hypothetical protein